MLHDKNVPGKFWVEAMHTAAFVVNRIPQQNLDYKSPYEKLFEVKPNVSYFRVFGSVCYVFIPSSQRHKLEKKAVRSIFVGYDSERKESKEALPDSDKLKTDLESNKVCLPVSGNETIVEDEVDQEQPNEPWQTGVLQQPPAQPEELRRSTRIRKPNPKYAVANLAELMEEEKEPESFEEANSSAAWRAAMKHEIDALLQNETWTLVPKPQEARLVARGFTQQVGIDYEETFSPVAKLTYVRVLIAVAATKGWPLFQMDVNNAFLYGTLDHVIYMTQPLGFEDHSRLGHVCKLKKAIYGLKQSPRAWYGKIAEFLEVNGFESTSVDASLFVKRAGEQLVVVLVYVDDLIITGSCVEEIQQIKANLCTRFCMKDLGVLKRFLGLEINYEGEHVLLHQTAYSADLLLKFGMLDSKPAWTPVEPNLKLYIDEGKDLDDETMYRKIVGSLIYLTLTRPDIAFIVGVLSRFMQHPKQPHLHAVRRVLWYVKATLRLGVLFQREVVMCLVGYCDADYGDDPSSRRSTTGYVIKLGSGAISWCSRLQPTVSLSTTEAEYCSAAMAAQESTWLLRLLAELGQNIEEKMILWCDNVSAIKLAENPTFHARTKHIEVHYHYIREKVLQGEIDL
ncbi:hypothetical protein E3N88_14570 [Mikania micrantha]|uniref:Uncharacterized protein n=1 Tax=Mikania micrantha TaxID=192012 RepID=A0A5N6P1T0_9ASTR|nr:hypothetical protein E3N88_14570 [Mikania micrantha]